MYIFILNGRKSEIIMINLIDHLSVREYNSNYIQIAIGLR